MVYIDLNRLIRTLEPRLRVSLEHAASHAARNRNGSVEVAHFLRSILDQAENTSILDKLDLNPEALRTELDFAIGELGRDEGANLTLSQNLLSLAREAWLVASLQHGRDIVFLGDLLTALVSDSSLRLLSRAIAPSLRGLDMRALEEMQEESGRLAKEVQAPIAHGAAVAALSSPGDEVLRLYTHDLTAQARDGRIDPVIGREREMRQVIDVLMRRRQNNPILVGEAGVGKTAVAEALALGIVEGDVPEMLRDVRLLMLDLSLLQAGAGVKGEFERRLHGVVDAVKASVEPIILFIDEAHGLIGAGGHAGQGDAANILKPALARGELRTIAATTWSEYKRYFEKDAALTRRFQVVHVNEPDEETAIRMLRGIADRFERHHKVRIRDDALAAAVQLSARYIPARQLPDKAISLMDTAAAAVALARQTTPAALANLRSERTMLAREAESLRREPLTPAIDERLEAIKARETQLATEQKAVEIRLDAELRLVREADRFEEAFSPRADIAAGNIAAVPSEKVDPQDTGEQARKAYAATEKKRGKVAGEAALVPRVVDREVIAAVVARWTGIPVGKLLSDQVAAAKTLDARLKERVIGQDRALKHIADAMRAARAGLNDPRRPPAVFLFVGMSGTGKTETALALADMLYGGTQYLTTINMSEFKEEHKVSMLLGSPPGYVGYGEGGVLTEAVRRRPYGVLLLDEIDKAHAGVQEIFYQVFDKGTLRDGEGRDIDFKNTTIVMTANTGSELLASLAADPDTMPEGAALEAMLLPELQKAFKPAFVGRTTVLPFMPLTARTLAGIVDIQIERIRSRVAATYGASLHLSQAARDALVARAGTSEMGARVIEVMIARDLLPVLSTFFLDALADQRKVTGIAIEFGKDGFAITEPLNAANASARSSREVADKADPAGHKTVRMQKTRKAHTP
ncbi:type VI secretion system ATPase TssH [Limoniibacter endophyticus]|uniref:ClpV1 family T6SS ATPase n=1 Tax=Limoniibacter endophyticus TaxID=1565040 RepID=A0A8J3DGM5_9HYPH|nr:type VI secretion system ATPase TssH [Limoniibacter endophyticus]GHC69487.1 ClpV1 family T6SS ATPase [Limoniibacter endophyticus]